MSLEILIGADVAPAASNTGGVQSASPGLLHNGLDEIWRAADARIVNLEAPLTGGAEALFTLQPTGVCLCGDHIMDSGEEGLRSTRAALKSNHIAAFGAGEDLDEADQPYFFAKHGVRIGVYAVCEHEFSFATDRKAGANPLDLVNLSDRVREIKSNCDRLIVLYRGGRAGYPYPSPDMQRTCRKIAECGASLVVCQHGCCVGSSERWNNATIVYGLGGFLHERGCKVKGTDAGLIVRFTVGDYGADQVDYVPVECIDGGAALADETKAAQIRKGFEKRSRRIRVEGFVSARYEAYAAEHKNALFHVLLSGNPLLRTLNALSGRRPARLYGRLSKANMLNTLRCESERELAIRGLMHDVSPTEH